MDELDTREWLLTNGLGSFASGTVCDARTRTYHGWLVAALDPPAQRMLLFSHLEASLEVGGLIFALGTNFWLANQVEKVEPLGYRLLREFSVDPVPTWVWSLGDQWQLHRQIMMPYGMVTEERSLEAMPPFVNRVLVQYRYMGSQQALLRLRPIIGDRDFHQHQQEIPALSFSQLISANQVFLQALQAGKTGTPWSLSWSQGQYHPEETWYWSYYYPVEARRGLDYLEDLFSPGYLTVWLQPGETVTLEARVGLPSTTLPDQLPAIVDWTMQAEQQRLEQAFLPFHAVSSVSTAPETMVLWERLLQASDRFFAWQPVQQTPTIVAGYHWFGDRSRDTLLSIPGLTLTTGRFSLARKMLDRLGRLCCQGLIPNLLPVYGGDVSYRNIDCALWWIETLGLYLEATQDWEFLLEQYEVVKQIYKAFTTGTLYNIRIDASDGLITWDDTSVPLTWMDTIVGGEAVTLRNGKPVEINALWYSALCWATQWATLLADRPDVENVDRLLNLARRYAQQADQVKASMQKFWNAQQRYFYDRLEPNDRLDATIRPNAVLALSLHHCAFSTEQSRQVLYTARARLLTPYGLRTLDPADPAYHGMCNGTPDQRDRAYHQGTVWSWLLGPFSRAWSRFCTAEGEPLPLDLQPLLTHFQHEGCFDAIAEIFDGDAPHQPRGAIASASAIAELLRQWEELV
ncbi:glycogen debranching enzyme N-terminal domain-containing protein [Leptolyngbya sp. FACHB-321]|uniref:amylo-alpha-1,6-glucosidase n=1 Tax=Leptolyngbya sp. FACHB-321 TaxID=2692807 RepID=UPI001689D2C5|nr:amylo-alpha-1,6-glucosidase [Leptolyngbya sp. FACHB-321]MBD2036758.1 glycogen debranching enzyme N-terminal domain-containing protein [Leptolyngbya sp. FACHB-321]